MGMITGQGSEAAKVTSEFLRSKGGVRRALQLAGEEMVGIAEDVWGEEVWGTDLEEGEGKSTRLMLYFGRNDHFVDEDKRDALMAKRGGKGGVRFEIDEAGIPHAFCLSKFIQFRRCLGRLWVGGAEVERRVADMHRSLGRDSRKGGAVGGRNGFGHKGGIEGDAVSCIWRPPQTATL